MSRCIEYYVNRTRNEMFPFSYCSLFVSTSKSCRPIVYNIFLVLWRMQDAVPQAELLLIRNMPIYSWFQNIFQLPLTYKISFVQLCLYLLREGGEHQRTQLACTDNSKTICDCVRLLLELMLQPEVSPPSALFLHLRWALLKTHLQGFPLRSAVVLGNMHGNKSFPVR